MSKEDTLVVEGVVQECLPNTMFRVQIDDKAFKQPVLAHLSGKMRMNFIKILPGDRVKVEMSVYDVTKGRITYRFK